MNFTNCSVFCDDGFFRDTSFSCEKGLFCEPLDGAGAFDLGGKIVIPGLIDIHFHGCAGLDFTSGTSGDLLYMARWLAMRGTTAFVPTVVTAPADMLRAAFSNVVEARNELSKNNSGAEIVGTYLEGPFLSKQKRGAHPEPLLTSPNIELVHELNALCGGLLKICAVAPELDDALNFIRFCSGICLVAVAHTECDYDTAVCAIESGASHLTHLYNAMPPFLSRAPGVIGAFADSNDTYVELICDGVHSHPAAIRAAYRLFGKGRIALISDSVAACGASDGVYPLGVTHIRAKSGLAVSNESNSEKSLAGSASTLFECVKNAIRFGVPAETAILSATKIPAERLGIYNHVGSITPGKKANFLVCDANFTLEAVYIGGVKADVKEFEQ